MNTIQSPKSAYIHIPFCRHRCGYCNFALVANRDYLIDRFLAALKIELSSIQERIELQTLFLGGGTPTHLSNQQLRHLFEMLGQHFDFSNAEVTSEANPSDLTSEKIETLFELGINRISLGVQSFRSEKLQQLERDHSAEVVERVVNQLQAFTENISFDLIFATMGEGLDQWQADLKHAISLQPKHLSTYELTIEKGTAFWNRERLGQLVQTDENLRAEMYQSTIEILEAHGFGQYEISSFAKEGFRCRHNLTYWSGQPYLAFGAGASGYIDQVRKTNHGSVSTYIKRIEAGQSPVELSERLSSMDRAKELLVVGLRRMDGVNQTEFHQLTQLVFGDVLTSRRAKGLFENELIKREGDNLRLTQQGVLLYDSIAEVILE